MILANIFFVSLGSNIENTDCFVSADLAGVDTVLGPGAVLEYPFLKLSTNPSCNSLILILQTH